MANPNFCYDESTARNSLSGGGGVCMMRNSWRDEQHPLFVNFISAFLGANSFRLNFVPIDPDLIFNCGGLSVAFIFVTNWDCSNISSTFLRVQKLKGQFANLYVIVTLSNKDQNDSFVRSYFKYEMDIGKPTFVPVQDMEMGFEKIVRIALARGVCKRQNAVSKLRNERKRSVQTMEAFLRVVATIPTIDTHDANSLNQAIGSIEDLSKASKEYILQSTDLSADKAEMITKFFRDSEFYLSPHIQKETM